MSSSRRSRILGAVILGLAWRVHGTGSGGGTSTSMTTTSSSPSVSSPLQTKTVIVGYNGHSFMPDSIAASSGDTIEFNFQSGNHSIVRAEYMWPCVPYETTGAGKTGFWSGFFTVASASSTNPKWRLTITDTNPIFFYSSGPDDCNKYGMVGGINVQDDDLKMQYNMSLDSPTVVQPSAAYTQTSTPISPPLDTTPPPITPAAIAGIAIGAVLALILTIALTIWYFRSSSSHLHPYPQLQAPSSPFRPSKSDKRDPDGEPPSHLSSPTRTSHHHHTSSLPSPTGYTHHSHTLSCSTADEDTLYLAVKRSALIPTDLTTSASPSNPRWSSSGESGVLRPEMLRGGWCAGAATPASTVPSPTLGRADTTATVRRAGHGAGLGTGVLEGTGRSLFPFNNDGVVVGGRGGGGVSACNMRPSELES